MPTNIVGLVFYIFWLIGFSYRAANDPSSNFLLSFLGFTLGVGLCEEICKALPLIFIYRRPNGQSSAAPTCGAWRRGPASAWRRRSSTRAAFTTASRPGIYFVRNISCVALHALWTGSAAITIHQRQHLFQQEIAGTTGCPRHRGRRRADGPARPVRHAAEEGHERPGAGGRGGSFLWLAFQISRLRRRDGQTAQADMLREYQRRRKAMGTR